MRFVQSLIFQEAKDDPGVRVGEFMYKPIYAALGKAGKWEEAVKVFQEAKDETVEETSEESKDEQVDEVVELEDEAKESETTEEESIEEVGGDATDELVKDISADEEGAKEMDKGVTIENFGFQAIEDCERKALQLKLSGGKCMFVDFR